MPPATELSEIQKISIILGTLPDDQCVEVLKNYPEEDVERICTEMVHPIDVDEPTRAQVLKEFSDVLMETQGRGMGLDAVEGVLARLYGVRRSSEMLGRLKSSTATEAKGLSALAEEMGAVRAAKVLSRESSGVIAFALAELPNALAAKILVQLPEESRGAVLLARARGASLRPEIAQWFREGLREALAPSQKAGATPSKSSGASEILASAEILSQLATEVSKGILDTLTRQDPELGKKVAEALFTFEDLVRVDDKDLQRLLGKINQSDLKVALRKTPEVITEKIYKNMSERMGTALKEEIMISPPQKWGAVQEAQRRIASMVRDMVRNKEIVLLPAVASKSDGEASPAGADLSAEEQLV